MEEDEGDGGGSECVEDVEEHEEGKDVEEHDDDKEEEEEKEEKEKEDEERDVGEVIGCGVSGERMPRTDDTISISTQKAALSPSLD